MGFKEYIIKLNEEILYLKRQLEKHDSQKNKIENDQELRELAQKYRIAIIKKEYCRTIFTNAVNEKININLAFSLLKDNENTKGKYLEGYTQAIDGVLYDIKQEFKNDDYLEKFKTRNLKTEDGIKEFNKKYITTDTLKAKYDKELQKSKELRVHNLVTTDPISAIEVYKNYLPLDEFDKIVENIDKIDICKVDVFAPTKKMDNEINEIIQNNQNKELNDLLKKINNDILLVQNKNIKDMNSYIADYYCGMIEGKNSGKLVEEYHNNNNKIKDLFMLGNNGNGIQNPSNNVELGDIVNEYKNKKFKFSKETIDSLKETMDLILKITNYDGSQFMNPNIDIEQGEKEYVFAPLFSDKKMMEDIIKQIKEEQEKDSNSPKINEYKEELEKVVKHYEQNNEIYKKLMEIQKNSGMTLYAPSNVSTSRNEEAPSYIMNEPILNARINGASQLLKFIMDSGLTYEEFLNDIDKGVEVYIKKLEKYSSINKAARNLHNIPIKNNYKSPLIAMLYGANVVSFNSCLGKYNSEVKPFRQTNILNMLEKDPEMNKANIEKTFIIDVGLCDIAQEMNVNIAGNFYNTEELDSKENIKTFKNLLVAFHDENINVVSLSANVNAVDPFTNEKIESFDYLDYLKNENTDYKKIVESIREFKLNKKIFNNDKELKPNEKKPPDINEILDGVCKTVANDLMRFRNLENETYFEEVLGYTGTNLKDYYIEKAGTETFSTFLRNSLNNTFNNHVDKDNIAPLMNQLTAINDKYYSRNWFVRHFFPSVVKEGNVIDDMKKNLTKAGIPEDTLKNVLKKQETISSLHKKYVDGTIKPYDAIPKNDVPQDQQKTFDKSIYEKQEYFEYKKISDKVMLNETEIYKIKKNLQKEFFKNKENLQKLNNLSKLMHKGDTKYILTEEEIEQYIKSLGNKGGNLIKSKDLEEKIDKLKFLCDSVCENDFIKFRDEKLGKMKNCYIKDIMPLSISDNKVLLNMICTNFKKAKDENEFGELIRKDSLEMENFKAMVQNMLYNLYSDKNGKITKNSNILLYNLKSYFINAYDRNTATPLSMKIEAEVMGVAKNYYSKIKKVGLDQWLNEIKENQNKIDYNKNLSFGTIQEKKSADCFTYQHLLNKNKTISKDDVEFKKNFMDDIMQSKKALYEGIQVLKNDILYNPNTKMQKEIFDQLNINNIREDYYFTTNPNDNIFVKNLSDFIDSEITKQNSIMKHYADLNKKVINFEDIPTTKKEDNLYYTDMAINEFHNNLTKPKYIEKYTSSIMAEPNNIYEACKIMKDDYLNKNTSGLKESDFNNLNLEKISKDYEKKIYHPFIDKIKKFVEEDYKALKLKEEMEKNKETEKVDERKSIIVEGIGDNSTTEVSKQRGTNRENTVEMDNSVNV